ncbi:MAG: CBM21 domain-containing protein [Lachnospiraceae bacterium]|nr:CBM21 domain-containing protein [Lachnospiraceae bacterium]MDE6252327.1 CBM21 domain-containing protein [Lachnospiraceae bacterium]
MKTGKKIKKVTVIILALAIIFGVFGISGMEVTVKASDSPVKMYYCDHVLSYHGSVTVTVYVQVDSRSAVNRQVYIHHSGFGSGDWEDVEAAYCTKLDDNTEIWKATITGYETSLEFAIKYIGDGKVYWDNNNGNNYTYNNVLGIANVKAGRLYKVYSSKVMMFATVKNLAYNKNVKVRYTTDNWETYKDESLGYLSNIPNTNDELWSVELDLDGGKTDGFHFCISYEVNGQTYWDNNFGANFDLSYNCNR